MSTVNVSQSSLAETLRLLAAEVERREEWRHSYSYRRFKAEYGKERRIEIIVIVEEPG